MSVLSDLFVLIKGNMYSLFGQPVVQAGVTADGDCVPVAVNDDGSLVAGAPARTSNWQSLGASASFTIPTTAKAWTVTFLTGTGTIGGKAVSAGFSDSSSNPPAVGIAIATDAASSAYIRYET